jgi:hypothetical protein
MLPCFSFFISFLSGDNVTVGKYLEVIEACIEVTVLMIFVGDEDIRTGFEPGLFRMDGEVTIPV